MKHTIIFYPHETLTKVAEPVEDFGSEFKILLSDMKQIMISRKGVGIAAPQVNKSWRCFLVHINDEILTFINPSITKLSHNLVYHEEGCLSVPGVYADVERPDSLEITAQDEHGAQFTLEADGFLARVIQHEYDHLNGVLFFEHLSSGKKRRLLKSYEKQVEEGVNALAFDDGEEE